jgi:cytochrome P450
MLAAERVGATASAVPLWAPGPRGLPYFGCLNGLLGNPMLFWAGIANRYGGIARVPLKGKHVYLISDPTLLYELLVSNRRKYRRNTRYKAAVDTFGQGLLLTEGKPWARQRKITQPTFKTDYIEGQVPAMTELIGGFLEHWKPSADAEAVRDVGEEFLRLSQLLAGHYLMGPGFSRIEERFYSAAIAVKDNWPLPPRNIAALFLPKSARRERRLDAAIAELGALVLEYLAEQRESDFENCGVLSAIVATSRTQRDPYSDQSLRDQLLTLFFAGHETSATSLSWIHYLLWKHPDVRDRVRREVSDTVGQRQPTAADLAKLEYTERVINEVLRLNSPIHSLSRVALEDDVIGGFRIPEGATIYVSLYATHRLPELWPEPDKFDPDRFLPELCAARPRFAFIPFAAGHRNCVGGSMAMTELKLAVAQLAQRYVLDVAPGHRVVQAAGTTMYPRYGMKMIVRNAPEQPA